MAKALAQLDLNLLVVLDRLLSAGSVTDAGKALGLSQPATSAALGRLRDFFEDPLLVRTGRKLEPTPFALTLREPVRDIIASIEATIERRAVFAPETSQQEFTLAASDYAMLVLARELHATVARQAPGVRLRFAPLELSAAGATSVVPDLFVCPKAYARGHHEALFRDRWVCVVDRDNPQVGARLTPAALRRLPFIRYAPGFGGTVVDDALGAAGVGRPGAMAVASLGAALLLIPGTRFVTLCPERLTRIPGLAPDVRVLNPPFRVPR